MSDREPPDLREFLGAFNEVELLLHVLVWEISGIDRFRYDLGRVLTTNLSFSQLTDRIQEISTLGGPEGVAAVADIVPALKRLNGDRNLVVHGVQTESGVVRLRDHLRNRDMETTITSREWPDVAAMTTDVEALLERVLQLLDSLQGRSA